MAAQLIKFGPLCFENFSTLKNTFQRNQLEVATDFLLFLAMALWCLGYHLLRKSSLSILMNVYGVPFVVFGSMCLLMHMLCLFALYFKQKPENRLQEEKDGKQEGEQEETENGSEKEEAIVAKQSENGLSIRVSA